MTDVAQKRFSEKHPSGSGVSEEIKARLMQEASSGELPCAVAFKIASETHTQPEDVGRAADLLDMRLTQCQLGLFGYSPAKRIV